MNEFEKDDILEEEETASSEAEKTEEIPEDGNGLKEELENLRDMFQEELDKASKEPDEEMIIQELEDVEYSEEDDENPDARLCECCGEKPCSEEYGEDYPYCEDCRNLMKKYPLRASGIVMTILMLAFFIASIYFSYPYMEDALTVADASTYHNSGYITNALQSYYTYFNGGKSGASVSKRALKECIEGYLLSGYHTDASTLIGTYMDDKDLKMPWNKKYANIVTEATVLRETYDAVSEITSDALYGGEFDYDEVMAALEALKEAKPVEEGTSEVTTKYNEVFIEYYKYIVMSVNKDSLESQLEQLKKIDAIGAGMEWAYLPNFCATAAKCGDEATVNSTFDRLIKINKQDPNAYLAKANYYRYLDKPDTDKILEICEEAEKAVHSNDKSYKHPRAIAYILKGEGALALEEMETLFSSGSYTVPNCNLYALCGLYTGDESLYNDMTSLLASYGYEISDLVTQYKDGKITIEEVLMDKGGDI